MRHWCGCLWERCWWLLWWGCLRVLAGGVGGVGRVTGEADGGAGGVCDVGWAICWSNADGSGNAFAVGMMLVKLAVGATLVGLAVNLVVGLPVGETLVVLAVQLDSCGCKSGWFVN